MVLGAEGCRWHVDHRTDPLPHFLEAQGREYQELLAVFNSQPAVGVDRLGAETPRRCPEPHIPSLLSQGPRSWSGGGVGDFKSCSPNEGGDMPARETCL